MQARLQVRLSENKLLEGSELEQDLTPAQLQALRGLDELNGRIRLEHDGQPAIEIRDDLEELVPRLCVWSRPRLAAGEVVELSLSTADETVTLTPKGAELQVGTTWELEAVFPLGDCVEALRRCGLQYLGFIDRHLGGEPAWREAIDDFKLALAGIGEPPAEADPPDPHQLSEEEMRRIVAEQNAQG